jgi:cysteine desulfurase
MAVAARITAAERAATCAGAADRRDRLEAGLAAAVPGLHVTAASAARVPGIAHVCIEGIESEALIYLLEKRGVLVSAASSCSSGALESSHVLAAMGVPDDLARGSVRLSLGPGSTDADIDLALDAMPAAVERLRSFAAPVGAAGAVRGNGPGGAP